MNEELHPTPALGWYIAAIAVAGPLVGLGAVLAFPMSVSLTRIVLALCFVIVSALAERTALRLTHHTHVSVSTGIYVAMFWLVPPAWAGAIAFSAVLLSESTRMHRARPGNIEETLFNVGQTALYVSLGAGTFALLNATLGTHGRSFVDVFDLVLAGAAMHAANTFIVATAGAIQSNVSPTRAWLLGLSLDLPPHVVMVVFGSTAAIAIRAEPFVLPAIVLPFALTHIAIGKTIGLRDEERRALASLVDIVELRDPYTAGHSLRVAVTARLIARRLGLTEEEADLIESAGRVHDLGKVAVDPSVLLKVGKLTDDEWSLLKLHPVYGADVVKKFSAYGDGVRLVRHHHERWDGNGYPDGLAGEAIPLGARVLAVADTFDALTSDRPYRAGMSVERAIEILKEGAGLQWDEYVVDAMLGILADSQDLIPLYRVLAADEKPAVAQAA